MSSTGLLEIRCGDGMRSCPIDCEVLTVGRASDNQVVLDDPQVSRRHARIELEGGRYHIVDLGSANGTRVNGVEIEPRVPRVLEDGDSVCIGVFTISLRDVPGAVEDATRIVSPPNTARDATMAGQSAGATMIAPPEPRLIVTTPRWAGEFPLREEAVTIGRDPKNDIVIDDPVVSRHHAKLARSGPSYEITDTGSANGLTLAGQPVGSRILVEGDVLRIAQTVTLAYRTRPVRDDEPAAPRRLDLGTREVVTIGRHQDCDVCLDHPAVSRTHARVARRNGGYAVEDLGSSNGTFVNGEAVAPGDARALRPGDTIRVGPVRFTFGLERLEQVDESRDLRLDALHLSQPVAKGINLLQDISLSIHPREFVAVVGVSGAGKSTLLDALNGFRPARQGTVLVNGTDLYRSFDAFRTNLGYVPQDDIIHKELSVQTALDYAAQLRLPPDTTEAERLARVREVMETLGLSERRDVPIARLSGGQRKRVSIGVELLTKPGLFYLDEATSGLDPGTESQLMRLLRKLADQGHTVLLITHATKNVMLCDQVVFLARGGSLAYYGPPDQALAYFEVEDFDGIYERLEGESTPEAWSEKYRQSDQYRQFVADRLEEKYTGFSSEPAGTPAASVPAQARARQTARSASALRQFRVLSSRYFNIIRRDRINLALLFLIAPALGTIDLIAWPRNLLDPLGGDSIRTMTMLFMAALVPFLVGALSSVREVVKETPIYKRERTVSLKIAPYLLSKISVGFLFAVYHAAALFAFKVLAVDFSHLATLNLFQFYVTLALAAMSGVMWGLLISAFVPREEQAMLLVIGVVVVQMVFSGGLLPLSQLGTAGDALGGVTSTKWSFEALTASANVKSGNCAGEVLSDCHLPGLDRYATDPEKRVALDNVDDRFSDVFAANVYESWMGMAAIMTVLLAVIIVLQKRKDVI